MIMRCASLPVVLTFFFVLGCSRDDEPELTSLGATAAPALKASATQADPPSGLVSVGVGGQSLTVWPYTGTDFGTPSDPLNLVWSDAMGGVQTGYAEEGEGWLGSVIQLQLGSYGPVRFHLRLFDTRAPFGDDGTWTLGGCHIEILIPGTADHQVIAWELAEQIVKIDFARSGLLGADPAQSDLINPAPGYRDIPPAIYNGIPDALKIVCGLPPGPSAVPVPIPTDGRATLLLLADYVGVDTDASAQEFTLQYRQYIPRPFCSGGPLDFLLVEGPVLLSKDVLIGNDGRYEYGAEIRGQLTATPVDVTQSPPVVTGDPFSVTASDVQHGFLGSHDARVSMQSNRLVFQDQVEKQFITLVVHEKGMDSYREQVRCLTD